MYVKLDQYSAVIVYHKSLNDGKLGWLKQKILGIDPVKQDPQRSCK